MNADIDYKEFGEYLKHLTGKSTPEDVMRLLGINYDRGEDRCSFIILYKKNGMKYIINRSCYLGSISIPWEVVANYMMTEPENIRNMIHQAQQDTSMEILEVIDKANFKRGDQSVLNEHKKYWAEKYDAKIVKDVEAMHKEFTNLINNKSFNYNGLLNYLNKLKECIGCLYEYIKTPVGWDNLTRTAGFNKILYAFYEFKNHFKDVHSRYSLLKMYQSEDTDKSYKIFIPVMLAFYDKFYSRINEKFPFESNYFYKEAKSSVEHELMKLDIIIGIVSGDIKVKHNRSVKSILNY